jgi:Flp pilus assembly protein TadG
MMFRALGSLRSNVRGAAVIEMAMVAPVLALGVIGIVDMSNAYSKKLALEQGTQRAIEKIMNTTETSTVEATLADEVRCQVNGSTTAGGVTTCNTKTGQAITVTWRLDCKVGTVTTTTTTVLSSAYDTALDTCTTAAGTKSGYVQVSVSDTYTPLFPIHFAHYSGSSYPISATAGTRTM